MEPLLAQRAWCRRPGTVGLALLLLATASFFPSAAAATKVPTVTPGSAVTSVTVEPEEPATLSVSAGATTWRLDVPERAVLHPITVTMRVAKASNGQPAIVLEPSGWVLLRPATLTVTGQRPKALWAWGPAGHARALLAAAGSGAAGRVLVGLGTVVGSTSTAAPSPVGETEEERFTRTEEADEAKRPDRAVNVARAAAMVARAKSPKPCKKGNRAAAAAALQAVRTATAISSELIPPPECLDVHVQVFTQFELTGNVVGVEANVDEQMRAEGDLSPTEDGHEGSLPVVASMGGMLQGASLWLTTVGKAIAEQGGIAAPPPSEDRCTGSAPYGGHVDAAIRWAGGDTATLRLDPTSPKYDWSCGALHDTSELATWQMFRVMFGREDDLPIELEVSVLQGSVRLLSQLLQWESLVQPTKKGSGVELAFQYDGMTVRIFLSVEVSYSLA